MINNNTNSNIEEIDHENQLLVSFELICLIRWILENEDEKIKKIIVKALNSGLQEDLNKKAMLTSKDKETGLKEPEFDDMQSVILDFFYMMETLLMEAVAEHAVKKVIEKNLMPSIDRIDSSVCDDATLRFSIEKAAATKELGCGEKAKAKKILMSELLKRWKPKEKNVLN